MEVRGNALGMMKFWVNKSRYIRVSGVAGVLQVCVYI